MAQTFFEFNDPAQKSEVCLDNKARVGEKRESGPRNRLAPDDYYYTQVEHARGERVLYSVLYRSN